MKAATALEYGWSSSEFESRGEQIFPRDRSGVLFFLRGDHRKQAGVPAVCWGTACLTRACGQTEGVASFM